MRLASIGLRNFLSYRLQPPVSLGRLNIFVGRNSAGKSAVLHALALLGETANDPSPNTSFVFAGNGLNLGTYEDVVHRNDNKQPIGIDLSFTTEKTEIPAAASAGVKIANRLKILLKYDRQSLSPYISAATVFSDDARLFTAQGQPGRSSPGLHKAHSFPSKPDIMALRWNHFVPGITVEYSGTQVPITKESAPGFFAYSALNGTTRRWMNLFSNLVYLGPSRAPLDSVYLPGGRYPSRLDSTGSNAVPLLLGIERTKKISARVLRTFDEWLARRFELVSQAQLQKLRGEVVRLQGKDPLINATVLLSNTGYGVSQVLPIVIQLAVGTPGILLIEQPEIHLHPSAQAELANLLMAFVESGYQLFVETHSEHLILRLRGLLARRECALSADDIKLFHVDKTKKGSLLRPVAVDETGKLSGWPRGFFSASSDDLVSVLKGSSKQ